MSKKAIEDGSYIALTKCFVCGEDSDILLHKRFKDISEVHGKAVNKEPCQKCQKFMKDGVILISCRDGEEGSDNPYRTGGWWVIKLEAARRIFTEVDVDKNRIFFIPDSVCQHLGLEIPIEQEGG